MNVVELLGVTTVIRLPVGNMRGSSVEQLVQMFGLLM